MSHVTPELDATLRVAERLVEFLQSQGVDAVVIGALALAAHHHPRYTQDLDLAVSLPPPELARLATRLNEAGIPAILHRADAADPLGGVIDVRVPEAVTVQLVNFDNSPANGFPRLVREACATALPMTGTSLRVVDLPHLIAFKLYAGGPKSRLDVLEVLDRNPHLDLAALRRTCSDLGLGRQLERLLQLRDEP